MTTQTTTPTPRPTTRAEPKAASPAVPRRSGASRLWRGRAEDPPWVRPAFLGLLGATAVLYLWGLGASGWANSFYAAAAQAGSESWKAFLFGSSDAASSITVDKTPGALWVMGLSVRLFGLSSWSLLVPEALMGVASVGLLCQTVRRTTRSAAAGLVAGTVLALTPVAVLMFRFDNPDALMVLLLVGATAATLRALEGNGGRWLLLAGSLVGFAFLTKMLQAFLVLPALVLVYLVAANVPFLKRVQHLLGALAALVLSAGWWVALVSLWPASSRPYIGGSQHNSILELTLGYNGLGRLTGSEVGSVGGGRGGGWGATGILRMFGTEVGGQVAWLIPGALIVTGGALWFTRRAPRTDRVRTGLIAWGLWLLVTGLTFSFMAGIFHPYYTVALAPAIGALVGIGAVTLWRHRESYAAAIVLACAVALSSALAFLLLDRTPTFVPWLRYVVVLLGFGSALLLVGVRHLPRRVAATVAAAALGAVLLGPAAYAVETAAKPHSGAIPTAGPSSAQGFGGGAGPGGPGGMRGRPPGMTGPAGTAGATGTTGTTGHSPSSGGLLDGSQSSAAMTALLSKDAASYTWVAAAVGSNSAAGYQLATGDPVMAIGGFNGSDPSPTLAQFKAYVANGQIHYFIAGGGMGGGPRRAAPSAGGSTSSQITSWVESHFTAKTVDGVTVYDLSAGVK